MKNIKTTYRARKNDPERTIYWEPKIKGEIFTCYGEHAYYVALNLKQFIETSEKRRDWWKSHNHQNGIVFQPVLIEDREVTRKTREYDIGREVQTGKTIGCMMETKKLEPIVIRGYELPEIQAHVSHFNDEWHVYFSACSHLHGSSVSDADGRKLTEWFGPQLIEATNEKLFNTLLDERIERAKKYSKQNLQERIDEAKEELVKVEAICAAHK